MTNDDINKVAFVNHVAIDEARSDKVQSMKFKATKRVFSDLEIV